jgi:hypothetical protein
MEIAFYVGIYFLPTTIWFLRGKFDSLGDMFVVNFMVGFTVFCWPFLLWKAIFEE